jgi:ABC-type bacteriocin/lantibiotic exporter with double-glycine peptidase domain
MANHLWVGSLVAFNALALLAASPLLSLLGLWDRWQEMRVILTRMRDIIDRDPEQVDGDGARLPVVSLEGRLTLRGVGFRYATNPDIPLLEGIDLDVPPGTTVAIVGRSGSGKWLLVSGRALLWA